MALPQITRREFDVRYLYVSVSDRVCSLLPCPIVFRESDGAFMTALRGIPLESRFNGPALEKLAELELTDFPPSFRVLNLALCDPDKLRYDSNELIKVASGRWAGHEALFSTVGVVTHVGHSEQHFALSVGISDCSSDRLHAVASAFSGFQYYNVKSREGGLTFISRFRSSHIIKAWLV